MIRDLPRFGYREVKVGVVLTLVQFAITIGGTLFVRAMLRLHEQAFEGVSSRGKDLAKPAAAWIRDHTLPLLLVPVVWFGVALWLERRQDSSTWLETAWFIIGIAATSAGVVWFIAVGSDPVRLW